MVYNQKNPDNPIENGAKFTKTQKWAPDVCKKPKTLKKGANVKQSTENINYKCIVYVEFDGERPHLADFANAMIRHTNRRDPGTVNEMSWRYEFSIKHKKQRCINFANTTKHQTIMPKVKGKIEIQQNKIQKKVTPFFAKTKFLLNVSLNRIVSI